MSEITELAELLIRRLKEGILNDQEEAVINSWRAESAENEILFQQLSDPDKVHDMLSDYGHYKKIIWNKLTVLEPGLKGADEAPVRYIGRWKYVVAASIFLVLSATTIYLLKGNKKDEVVKIEDQQTRFKNDVSPANQATILQLSDGKKIYVDSVANGSFANQGNMKIIKKDGEVIYEFTKTPNSNAVVYNTLITAKGDQQQLVLSDGSRVWMNAQSSIRFPAVFTGKERKVEITGEFFFSVAKNKKIPFIVEHNGLHIEVTGTQFNVNTYEDETAMRTTLIEGAVKVSLPQANSKEIQLIPGQQAEVNGTNEIIINKEPNIEETTAWRDQMFLFEKMHIENIMRQVARWYDVDIVFQEKIDKYFVATLPRDVSLSRLLRIFELMGGVHFKIEGKKITVMP